MCVCVRSKTGYKFPGEIMNQLLFDEFSNKMFLQNFCTPILNIF